MPKTVAISEKPWSAYKESDYTLEQWDAACLIHQHSGPPTAKSQCKLPVKTPDGTLSRAGVHAAAGALAGARGGVDATSAEKASAARALIRCYGQLGEQAPPSMSAMMHVSPLVGNFLAHINLPGSPPSPETVTHPSGGKGGGGNFDESKVKRDKGGKFAKKADAKALNDLMDAMWLDKLVMSQNMDSVAEEMTPELEAMLSKMAKDAGAGSIQQFLSDPKNTKTASIAGIKIMNEGAKQSVHGVSPSGTKVLQMYWNDNAKKDENPVQIRAVSYSGPNPHPGITRERRTQLQEVRRLNRQSSSRSGFRFNPNAVLDPSRVHDVSHAEGRTAMDQVEDFLQHVGVKGMKWGVRRSELSSKVRSGQGTIAEAHQAALKSTGHRAANFFLGDKTYWKRSAQILGITAAAIAVAAIPGLVPAAALAGVASGIGYASGAASTATVLTNFHRAIFGNRKITKSMENLGKDARRRQKNASDETKRLLNAYGSIPKKSFEHSETLVHADQTVQQVWDSLSPAQLDTMETIIGLALDESNAEGVVIDTDAYNSMSDIQKTVSTFVMAGALANAESSAQHTDVDDFLQHVGVKGMKWGQHLTAVSTTQDMGGTVRLMNDVRAPKNAKETAALKEAVNKTFAINHKAMDTAINSLNHGEARKIFDTQPPSGEDRLRNVSRVLKKELDALDKNYEHQIGFRAGPNKGQADMMIVTYPKGVKMQHADSSGAFDPMMHSVTNMIRVTYDANGAFVRAEKLPSVSHSEELNGTTFSEKVSNFLKHYGVKGMKWGVRRGDNASGGSKPSKKEVKTAEAAKDQHISADADRFVKTVAKQGYEMSDREIKEVNARLEAIKKYNSLINDPNAELRTRVEAMKLSKEYAQYKHELNPSKLDRVNNFIKKVADGYDSYQRINKASNGNLDKLIGDLLPIPKSYGKHKVGSPPLMPKVPKGTNSSSNFDLKK